MRGTEVRYPGAELPLFRGARNFHGYYATLCRRWIRGNVLEVGGGLGAMAAQLLACGPERLTVCEPDPALAAELTRQLPGSVRVVAGGLRDVPAAAGLFDAIVYIDVLEHIDEDRREVADAAQRLRPGGALIIGGPAHAWLYSRFDAAIGHRRRYDRRSVEGLISSSGHLRLVEFRYFDCLGVALSLANRVLLRQATPTLRQVAFWDRVVLPLSRRVDRLVGYRLGKSFLAVACRTPG